MQALFRRLGSDGSYYEAAVPAVSGSTEIQVPFDDTVFSAERLPDLHRPSGSEPRIVQCIQCLLHCQRMRTVTRFPGAIPAQTLNPSGHWANYLFPALVGQRGIIDCSSNTQIGAIGIRALGTNALSTLPVIVIVP